MSIDSIKFNSMMDAPKLTHQLLTCLMDQGVKSVAIRNAKADLSMNEGLGIIYVGDLMKVLPHNHPSVVRFKPGSDLLNTYDITAANLVNGYTGCCFYSGSYAQGRHKMLWKEDGRVPLHGGMVIQGPHNWQGYNRSGGTRVEPGEFAFEIVRTDRKKMRTAYQNWATCRHWISTTMAFLPEPPQYHTAGVEGSQFADYMQDVCEGRIAVSELYLQEALVKGLSQLWARQKFLAFSGVDRNEATKVIITGTWRDIQANVANYYEAHYDDAKILRITDTDHAEVMNT